MEVFNDNDDITLILTNKNKNNNICEFETIFQKTIQLNQTCEIGIQEICCPTYLKTNKFNIEHEYKLIFLWNQDFSQDVYDKIKEEEVDNFNTHVIYEKTFKIPIGTHTIETLENRIFSKNNDYSDFIVSSEKKRFPDHDLDELSKFELKFPLVTYYPQVKKFKNRIGELIIKSEDLSSTVAYIYFNFDYQLHEILGFNVNVFPNVEIFNNVPTQIDEGYATFSPDLYYFNTIYVYTDIVKETYVGDQKVNILKVFAKKASDNDITIYSFENIFYVPLRLEEISSIKIQICDSNGQVATYDKGDITLTLCIRPIKYI